MQEEFDVLRLRSCIRIGKPSHTYGIWVAYDSSLTIIREKFTEAFNWDERTLYALKGVLVVNVRLHKG